MKIFVILLLASFSLIACKQNQRINKSSKTYDFSNVILQGGAEEMPVFQNGYEDLVEFIIKNIDYPKSAIRDSIEGLIWMELTIGKDGVIENAKPLHSIRKDIDKECITAFLHMPKWKPGVQKKMKVRVKRNKQNIY